METELDLHYATIVAKALAGNDPKFIRSRCNVPSHIQVYPTKIKYPLIVYDVFITMLIVRVFRNILSC